MTKRVILFEHGSSTGRRLAMARGRKRKEGVNRYPGGSILNAERGESEAEAKATVLKARASRVGARHANKYEAGFALGRAYLLGKITRKQLKAGEQWAMDVDRYHRMYGLPSPFPKAIDWLSVKGISGAPDPTPEQVRALANTYMRGITAVSIRGRVSAIACRALCIEDTEAGAWPEHTWSAVRKGLDELASLYGIGEFSVESEGEAA